MSAVAQSIRHRPGVGRIWLRFLGSMNLAITLLVAIAIASVIGTVLKQNQPYSDYIIKFGPFWHQVFLSLGLYDVYATPWFLAILAFLVVSTSVCIIRHAPGMLRAMREYRENIRESSLRSLSQRAEWAVSATPEDTVSLVQRYFRHKGYRTRTATHGSHTTVAAMKGRANRLGYLSTHLAIVIICLGALVDGNLPLKFRSATGDLHIETQDLPASQVPADSRLPPTNPSFRASVTIPEGQSVNVAFVNVADGYLVQELPFSIELKKFRIRHYPSGKPKSFESDLVIHDPHAAKPIAHTIAVNHPWVYKGYTIYQASFGDGGSKLQMVAHMLDDPKLDTVKLHGAVHGKVPIQTSDGKLEVEITNFRFYNINPAPKNNPSGKKFVNFGPSFTFKLRWPNGIAREYQNYMLPVSEGGHKFFLSGVRTTPAQPFRYLHIPADPNGTVNRFMAFQAVLHDPAQVRALAKQSVQEDFGPGGTAAQRKEVAGALVRLVQIFNDKGLDGLLAHVKKVVPKARQDKVMKAYSQMLSDVLQKAYVRVLRNEGINLQNGISAQDAAFYGEAVKAASAMHLYGAPLYLQLANFHQVQATGLQITRTPSKNIVYLGFGMLILGVFLMLYIPHERAWAYIKQDGSGTRILLAGKRTRHEYDFRKTFAALRDGLKSLLERKPPDVTNDSGDGHTR